MISKIIDKIEEEEKEVRDDPVEEVPESDQHYL